MHQKWLFRCEEFKAPEIDLDHRDMYDQCREWWTERDKNQLHRHNAYLRKTIQEPRQSHSKDYLREWKRTRKTAAELYARYKETTNQPTLHRWLIHKK